MSINLFEDDVVEDNKEIVEDIKEFDPTSIVVYSRDWTIETIINQIDNGNIDLNPSYQRRNAWTDEKRSKLIESIIIGYPVPEIVLAEDPIRKKSFAVIDGKQRLLTIAGFINPEKYKYWDRNGLSKLTVKKNLNGVSFKDLLTNSNYASELRQFLNSSLRSTIITNFTENDVLYDIFYRLNSGSVSLSTQELRQVLNRGDFANYLITVTNTVQPIHRVLNLNEPDKRLRDIEIILRCISIIKFAKSYNGNLKVFLDNAMQTITNDWKTVEEEIDDIYSRINDCINALADIFGEHTKIGRKYTEGKIESRFNRVLLEVQLFYFFHLDFRYINETTSKMFLEGFSRLCQENKEFRTSIESSTKTIDNYYIRFNEFQELINNSFHAGLDINPFKTHVSSRI